MLKSAIRRMLHSVGYDIRRTITPENVRLITEGEVVDFEYCSVNYRMFVSNAHDLIQRCYVDGKLYEAEELQIIAREFRHGGVFLDIGANVGNHAIFAAKALDASKVLAFEPVSPQRDILAINVVLNDLADVVTVRRVGLSNAAGVQRVKMAEPYNIGGARLAVDGKGEAVTLVRGDDALGNTQVDFVKIDVEQHEMLVLEGLENLISTKRPSIFAEVDNDNWQSFSEWLDAHDYRVVESFQRYPKSNNYLVSPA